MNPRILLPLPVPARLVGVGPLWGALIRAVSCAGALATVGAAIPAFGGNQALVTGVYAGTLGAGAATGAERSAFGQNPAALRPGRLGAHLDFHRPYEVADLEVAEAGVYLDGRYWGGSAEWRQTAVEGLYAEHGWQITQALRLGNGAGFPGVLDLGAAWNGWRVEWPGAGSDLRWSHGFGLAWRPVSRLKAGAFVLGLPLDPAGQGPGGQGPGGQGSGDGDPGSVRILQWGLEADSRDPEDQEAAGTRGRARTTSQILRLDFRKTGETPWRTLASLSLSPHPGLEITGGFAGPPFQVSAGARISWAGWDLRQALRYHRYLGKTWLSSLAFSRDFGP